MAVEQVSAPPRAPYGVHHANVRHTTRYTVIGNHLIQNAKMTLTARGLGAYIQSLPPGTPVGIKELARRVPEGEIRIAAALRELEAHGYLKRVREQLPNGRFVTRTVSYNRPRKMTHSAPPPPPPRDLPNPPDLPPAPEPEPEPEPEPLAPAWEPAPPVEPEPTSAPSPEPPEPPTPRRRAAMDILARLRRTDPRLLLGQRDIDRLADGVETWLERGGTTDSIISVLTARVPDPVTNPAGLIAHRLKAQLPPVLEAEFRRSAYVPPDPFQTCPTCDRAFRSPSPGWCDDCGDPP
ncbi:helix-turn-helix domain-containing protein [Streptomyces sp. NPDC087917]|uniref:helix-turn-helix domain-containing protein n=1 Tax=Streptomyces sp. NPDC087917 TaxID=3155060 RepID=UPI00342C9A52